MKIYDCFTYMNEDVVLDLRLNYLDNYVDKFVIVESLYFHSGKKKKTII
jgi:beta-1,4-mannosyl-glycoprotein beta-1,4-N-acetylglucosaminyltransferase